MVNDINQSENDVHFSTEKKLAIVQTLLSDTNDPYTISILQSFLIEVEKDSLEEKLEPTAPVHKLKKL